MQRHGLLKSSQLLVQQEYSLVLGDVMLPDSVFPVQSEGMFSQIQSTEYGITNYAEGEFSFNRGHKQYELSNHLGNVLVTIQDRKWGRQNAPQTNCDYYLSYVVTITDYHAFGSTITERSATFGGGYRFGFNNQEKETELGDYYAFEYRIHDARLGRFLSVDPLAHIDFSKTPYHFVSNSPIARIDLLGLTDILVISGKKKNQRKKIDDGNDLQIKLSNRQFDKLEKKFKGDKESYDKYLDKLSKKNGFTTSRTTGPQFTFFINETDYMSAIELNYHVPGKITYSEWKKSAPPAEEIKPIQMAGVWDGESSLMWSIRKHYESGRRTPFVIYASDLNFDFTNQKELKIIEDKKYKDWQDISLFNAKNAFHKEVFSFGKIRIKRVNDTDFEVAPNLFDFNFEPGSGSIGDAFTKRNMLTFAAGLAFGQSFSTPITLPSIVKTKLDLMGPFEIHIVGNIRIPKQ